MDYNEMAKDLLRGMRLLHNAKPHKHISESMHGEAFVLQYIMEHGGDVLPGEIGNEMHVSSARIATALNSLEDKGLVTRRIDRNDRRKILVTITEDGRAAAERQYQAIIACAAKILELLGENDAREYVRITNRMTELMPQIAGMFKKIGEQNA